MLHNRFGKMACKKIDAETHSRSHLFEEVSSPLKILETNICAQKIQLLC